MSGRGLRAINWAGACFLVVGAATGVACSKATADTLEWALVQAYQNNPSLNAQRAALRVIDEKTVYLRMPKQFMEPDTLLMVLRNLLKAAYDREHGESPLRQKAVAKNAS